MQWRCFEKFQWAFNISFLFFLFLAWSFITVGIHSTNCCESRQATAAVLPAQATNQSPESTFKSAGALGLIAKALILYCLYFFPLSTCLKPIMYQLCSFFNWQKHAALLFISTEYKVHKLYLYKRQQDSIICSFQNNSACPLPSPCLLLISFKLLVLDY